MSTDRRTIEVILTAKDSGYSSVMEKGAAKTRKTSEETKKLSPLAAAASGKLSGLTLGMTAFGLAAAGAMTLATNVTMRFDKEMSRSYAAVRGTADDNTASFQKMRKAALEASAALPVYSAEESASAMTELLKAGRSVSDVMSGELTQSLNMAAADGMDLASATSIMASTMTVFGRTGATAADVADTLAAGAGLAQGGIADLGEAMKYVGSQAAASNLTVEETVGLLATLANNGIQGSMAGTSLAQILKNLKTPTAEGQKALDKLGVSVWNVDGSFKGLTPSLIEVANKLEGMSEKDRAKILSQIFDVRAVNAAIPLLREATTVLDDGTTSLENMNEAVGQSGYATGQAATMLDNLAGDISKFQGAVELASISTTSGFNDIARSAVQSATAIVRAYDRLPDVVKSGIAGIITGLGGIALAGAGLIKAAEMGKKLRDSLTAIGVSARTSTKLVKGLGVAAGVVGVAVTIGAALWTAYSERIRESEERVKSLAGTMKIVNGEAQTTKATAEKLLETLNGTEAGRGLSGILERDLDKMLQNVGSNSGEMAKAILGSDEDYAAYLDRITADIIKWRQDNAQWWDYLQQGGSNIGGGDAAWAKDIMDRNRKEADQAKEDAKALADANNSLGTSYTSLEDAQRGAAESFDPLAQGTAAVAEEVDKANQALKAYIASYYALRDAASGLLGSESAMEAAIDATKNAIDKKNLSQLKGADIWNLNNEQVRKANDSLRGVADQARNYGAALMEQGYSSEFAAAQSEIAAASIVAQADKWGLSKDEVLDFAEAVTGVPRERITDLTVKGARKASQQIDEFESKVQGVPKEKVTEISAAVREGDMKKVMTAIQDLPLEQQLEVLTTLKDAGVKDAKKELKDVQTQAAKQLNVKLDGKSAKQQAKEVKAALDAIKSKTVTLTINERTVTNRAGGGQIAVGAIRGPGSSTSDSIEARLSNGEHVWTAREVAMAGGQDAMYRARAQVRSGLLRFASGGAVGTTPSYKGKRLEFWEDHLLSPLEMVRLEIQIRDLKSDLKAKEKYGKGKRKKTRYKLRGDDRTEAKLELKESEEELKLAKDAAKANKSKEGTLTERIEAYQKQIDTASDTLRDLRSVSDPIRSSLGQFDLRGAMEQQSSWRRNVDAAGNTYYTGNPADSVSGSSLAAKATARAAQVKAFAEKLKELQKAGVAGVLLSEIAALGTDEGGKVADAILADRSSIGKLNAAYTDMASFAGQAAQYVTEGYAKGGLAAAEAMAEKLVADGQKIGSAIAAGLASSLGQKQLTGLPGRASGGSVAAGQLYRVNELGVEAFRPAMNGYILNAQQVRESQHGATTVIHFNPTYYNPVGVPHDVELQEQLMEAASYGRMN